MKNYAQHFCAMSLRSERFEDDCLLMIGSNPQRVIVFDSLVTAQDFAYKIGGDRMAIFNKDGDVFTYSPIRPGKANVGKIWLGYNPYELPAGWPVPSEAHGKEWRHHVTVWDAFFPQKGQLRINPDGTVTNLALDADLPMGLLSP